MKYQITNIIEQYEIGKTSLADEMQKAIREHKQLDNMILDKVLDILKARPNLFLTVYSSITHYTSLVNGYPCLDYFKPWADLLAHPDFMEIAGVSDIPVHIERKRIKALRDIELINGEVVKEGELGGWIESEGNLDQLHNSWIAKDAMCIREGMVYDNALITDRVLVTDEAQAYQDCVLEGDIVLKGHVICAGQVRLSGNDVYTGELIISTDHEGNKTIIDRKTNEKVS